MSRDEWVQSGVIPYRFRKDFLEVLVITSSSGGKYIFPKGSIGSRVSAETAALREAREEAGVKGRIHGPRLGFYRYQKNGENFRVDMFPMRVTRILSGRHWPEADLRTREWMSAQAAAAIIHYHPLADMVLMMDRFATG